MFANKAHEEAYTLAKEGKIEEALIAFNKALLTAESPDIYGDRGVLYIHKNDKTNAMADFNKAIELQPDYSFRYSARAYAHEYFGDTESSIADYEKAIELDPSDAVAYNNLGLMQEKLGYKQMAQTNFELADKLAKQEKKLHAIMADLESNEEVQSPKEEQIQPAIEEVKSDDISKNDEQAPAKAFSEFSKLFTSREQFNAFLKFLKNGFKIK